MKTKDEIRDEYRAKRKAFSAEQCIYYSEQLCDKFIKNWNFQDKIIHCFLPIHRLLEVDTVPLIKLLKRNNTICIPVSHFNSSDLSHKILNESTIFQDNAHGIPEPVGGKEVKTEEIDVVIVPLLAVDQYGNRLGYGKGFYDRFLKQCKPDTIFIGLTMFDIHGDFKEVEEHDVALHYVVTPTDIISTKSIDKTL